MTGDHGEPGNSTESAPEYPILVRAAAILWILFGTVIPLDVLLGLSTFLFDEYSAVVLREHSAEVALGFACLFGPALIFGTAFIFVGYQTLKGSAKDSRSNGIGSFAFGLIVLACGVSALLSKSDPARPAPEAATALRLIAVAICVLAGMALLTAGVLAIRGSVDYKTWRRWVKRRRQLLENVEVLG
jgi:hypothetical protein